MIVYLLFIVIAWQHVPALRFHCHARENGRKTSEFHFYGRESQIWHSDSIFTVVKAQSGAQIPFLRLWKPNPALRFHCLFFLRQISNFLLSSTTCNTALFGWVPFISCNSLFKWQLLIEDIIPSLWSVHDGQSPLLIGKRHWDITSICFIEAI